jgi:diguanylate cyclase (GGDEF)-like protein
VIWRTGHEVETGRFPAGLVTRLLARLSSWSLWEHPRRGLVGYVLAVDTAAAAIAVAAFAVQRPTVHDIMPFGILMACAIVYTEMSRPIERVRERFAGSPHIDLNSVWMFAAVLLLNTGLAAVVIATSYGYRWWRVRRHVVHRQIFSAAATILAAEVASLLLASGGPFAGMPRDVPHFGLVVLAGATFLLTNSILVTAAVYAANPKGGLRTALGSLMDYSLEAATIALGILLAWALVAWPIALLLIVGITIVLHRGVLIRQLREQARTDGKTGLLHSAAWSDTAETHLTRRESAATISLLMLDLDHFKDINDNYGHLVGDRVLREVADTLKRETRTVDVVGRFGGEEFTILLPDTGLTDATGIAERLRRRIAERAPAPSHPAVTVSIGVATLPDHASTLEDLIDTADTALYRAKLDGRNRVATAETPTPIPSSPPQTLAPGILPLPRTAAYDTDPQRTRPA